MDKVLLVAPLTAAEMAFLLVVASSAEAAETRATRRTARNMAAAAAAIFCALDCQSFYFEWAC